MFSLGDILVKVKADTSEVKQGVKDVNEMGEKTKTWGEKLQSGMKVAAVGLGVVGAGLTLYAKSALNTVQQMVGDAKNLARITGESVTEASRLSAAFQRMGIDAGATAAMFGIFSKQINAAANTTETQKIAAQKLSIEMQKTQAEIVKTTAEIKKNGDNSGELSLKVKELENKLAELQDQAQTSATAFDQLGISTSNADGTTKGFSQLLDEVADKFKAMPDGPTKTALAMDLFGRSGKDMIKVLNLGSDGIEELKKKADELGLTLDENTISKIADLTKAQKDLAQSQAEIKIAVGTTTAPIFTAYNKILNDVLQSLLSTDGPLRTATIGFLAFGGPVASGAAALIGFLANLDQALPILAKMANALKITAAAQWLLNVAMAANPITLIALAIAAIIGALVLLYFNVDSVRNVFDAAFRWIWNLIQAVWNWISTNWPMLLAILTGPIGIAVYIIMTHLDMIKGAFAAAWQWIVSIWQAAGDFFRGIGQSIANGVTSGLQAIKNFGVGVWEGLKNGFKAAVNWVIDQANKLINAYNGTVGKIPGTPHVANLPRFARGTENFAGGGAVVGEEGPELGLFPKGTKIVPANLTANLVDNLMSVGDMLRSLLSGGAGAFLGAGGSAGSNEVVYNTTTNINGPINVGSENDADYLLNRGDRNGQLSVKGLSPVNPQGGVKS